MKNTRVIQLGQVRELLGEWEKVRQLIIAGEIDGWAAAIRSKCGKEAIYVGGVYRTDPQEALRATMKLSVARMMAEDDPLPLLANE